jgi:threonyl-tRNA synthetase
MPVITLPDGSRREYPQPLTVADIAASIGPGLARAALAGRVNGKLVDTSFRVEQTPKSRSSPIKARRSGDHPPLHGARLAQAVKELFPKPRSRSVRSSRTALYYDFAFGVASRRDPAKIEQRMHEIAKRDYPVSRTVMARDEAIGFFRDMGEEYKAKIIEDIPPASRSAVSPGRIHRPCRGPHVPSTGKLKAFKLMKVAGAYWRGDSHNEMLARIYGTAWTSKEALDAYLHQIEEAEKRDHRKIGRSLNLFHMQEEAPGMVFWHERGWRLYQQIVQYMRVVARIRLPRDPHAATR